MIEWHDAKKQNPNKESKLLIVIDNQMFFGFSTENITGYFHLECKPYFKFCCSPGYRGWDLAPGYKEPEYWAYINMPEGDKE